MDSEGVLDDQGLEFKAISANGLKLGATLAAAEHIPWLRWMFPLEEEAFAKHGAQRDRLTRVIMEEHTATRNKSGGTAQQHFVDALLTLREKYDLSEDTIIGLLWLEVVISLYVELKGFGIVSRQVYCLKAFDMVFESWKFCAQAVANPRLPAHLYNRVVFDHL
ncbi:hypothetical protein C3L33_11881, partial [Rhododendron williamsianum]